jgi:hypothetical protein
MNDNLKEWIAEFSKLAEDDGYELNFWLNDSGMSVTKMNEKSFVCLRMDVSFINQVIKLDATNIALNDFKLIKINIDNASLTYEVAISAIRTVITNNLLRAKQKRDDADGEYQIYSKMIALAGTEN